MTEESIAELRRRVSLLEHDAEGERNVSRTMLRKLNGFEDTLVDLTKATAEIAKGFGRLETFVTVANAESPRKFSEIAALAIREELAKSEARIANQITALREDIPRMVAEAVGSVMRAQK